MDAPFLTTDTSSHRSGSAVPARRTLVATLLCLSCLFPANGQQGEPASPDEQPTSTSPPADTAPDPAGDAELTDDSVEEARESLKQRRNSKVLFPSSKPSVDPAMPPSTLQAFEAAGLPALEDGARPPLLAEGSFLVRRRGVLLLTDWGAHIFAFAAGTDGTRTRPMVVLPCDTLRRMESAALTSDANADRQDSGTGRVTVIGHFIITGQVTAYRGRNCISPTAFSLADEREHSPEASASPDDTAPPTSPDRTPEDDPEIADLITDLEALRTTPRGATPVREASAEDETLVAEGTAIARRKARLVRSGRGELAVALDSGVDGREDPPMLLLPCSATEGLERAATRYGDSTSFDISGRVFTYQGRNYLLPLMYVAETSRNIKPLR